MQHRFKDVYFLGSLQVVLADLLPAVAVSAIPFVYRNLGDSLAQYTHSWFRISTFAEEMLRCVTSLATVWSLGLEVARVSLLADPPPKFQCLTIRKDFFLIPSTVGGVSTCYSVRVYYFFCTFHIVRPANALRTLSATSLHVPVADHGKRGIDLFWSDCSFGAACICDRIVSKYCFGFNGVSNFQYVYSTDFRVQGRGVR